MERILDWFVISEIFKEFPADLPCLCKSYNQRKNEKSRERERETEREREREREGELLTRV